MKINAPIISLFVVLALGIATGCKSKRAATKPQPVVGLDFEELIERVYENHADFETFSARISAQASFGNAEYSFGGSLRIVKDSAIFISATVSIIGEVARVVITPDSLKLLNRLEGTYILGDIGYLNRLLGARIDYPMLEAILIGNDLTHFSFNSPQVSTEKDDYVLTTNARTPATNPLAPPLQNRMWVSAHNYRIAQNIFLDLATNKMVRATYKKHSLVEDQLLPVEMDLLFSEPANNIMVSLQLTRVALNAPVAITFSVPSRYRAIE